MDKKTKTEIEAATLRVLRDHLIKRKDVQNIDLMNLAGFCRNCLSRWYQEAAQENGQQINKMEAREIFYGMPFDEWKSKYQVEASKTQKKKFKDSHVG